MIEILKGVGGSHNHGLETEESDVDIRGVFSHSTDSLLGLDPPQETFTLTSPDTTLHELKKFLKLCARGNPDVLETLALKSYISKEPEWGDRLLELTPALLSGPAIERAFIGYAQSQFELLKRRGDFGAGMERRTWKHAKHMIRLTETALWILKSGKLDYSVSDRYFLLEVVPQMTKEQLTEHFVRLVDEVYEVRSVLPSSPDVDKIEAFLLEYRKAH